MNKDKITPHKKLTVIISLACLLLFCANLLISNIMATSGEKLKQLQARKTNLIDQNERLRLQIVGLSSLEHINNEAQKLGLSRTEKVLSLTSQPVVAMNNP